MSETPLQQRVQPWMVECFVPTISADKQERNHRFLQEALELVQSCGATQSEAHQLVDYVYGRPVGKPFQEVGGVMITLPALCLANDLDMHEAGEVELARIWMKVEQIRAKQAAKPKHSPLPAAAPVVFAIDEKQPISIDRQAASIDIQAAQLAAPVAEPVEYQHRMRPTWRDEGEGWTEWEKRSAGSYDDYVKAPLLHDWQHEARKLYAAPVASQPAQAEHQPETWKVLPLPVGGDW